MNPYKFGSAVITLVRGDVTRQDVDAIVNAANSGLRGGAGVDGAIHRAAGPEVMEECRKIVAMQGQCAPGCAVITGGGKLLARYVIHAVGPIWRGGNVNEAQILNGAYRSCLELAVQNDIRSIAFPAISTGAYGYPLDEACNIALQTVKTFCENDSSVQEVRFVLFDAYAMNAYTELLKQI